ncbi:RsbR, positive regulator of sigma-B [Chondromyces apiculatus DSM 436]|uniref:RsbR, positive regulator of sigma-B n=2 Tax=Chondromyces apiculatus TaxID=51 RepID=A0A017THW2_9BACT|nr:RsbR, positive regulator of sigma-B [Chondromyces apiculatus DSM 436]
MQQHFPGGVNAGAGRSSWVRGWDHYFSASSDLLCVAGQDGFFRDLNPAWARTLGYTLEELRSASFFEFLHPDDHGITVQAMMGVVAAGGVTNAADPGTTMLINRYRRKDGTFARLAWTSVVVIDGLYYCVAQDTSARLEVEEALRASHERLQHLLLASGVGLYAIDYRGEPRLSFVSGNLRDQFGYTPEELREDPTLWSCRVHPDDRDRVIAELAALPTTGACCREYRWQRKDGTYRWVHDQTQLLRDAEGLPLEAVGSWQDVTARKEAERTIEQQAAALVELSTPLIPIHDQILVMPLIGMVDSRRAAQVMSTLLDGIAERSARFVILDITGVGIIDTKVADALLRAARAARLLGVEVILTGIRADVARTLVALEVDLRELLTFGKLQDGILHAMRRAQSKATR